jgi:hypothetical protein
LLARIRQLEHGMHISLIWLSSNRILWILKFWSIWFLERDELRKDIEQLCMQQAGPGYLAVATRMHFQRYLFILFIFLLLSGNLCTIEYLFIVLIALKFMPN